MSYVVRKYCPVCAEWREVRRGSREQPEVRRCRKHGKPWKGAPVMDANGYMRLRRGWGEPLEYEHRVVWENAHGPIPAGYHVHHMNHVRHDNRLENLELVLGARHNREHTSERHAAGEIKVTGAESKVWRADIDDEYIARRYKEGASLRAIGREVGATHNVISVHLRALGLRD